MRPGAKHGLAALAGFWCQTGVGHAAPDLPLLAYQPGINPQAFLPVSYRCPPGKVGTVEVTRMSLVGARIRVRVAFNDETPTHASVQRAFRGKPFEDWHEFATPLKKPEAEEQRNILQAALSEAEAVRLAICRGVPTTREKYDKILEHNRRHLRPPESD